jgi:hypothetical protein
MQNLVRRLSQGCLPYSYDAGTGDYGRVWFKSRRPDLVPRDLYLKSSDRYHSTSQLQLAFERVPINHILIPLQTNYFLVVDIP